MPALNNPIFGYVPASGDKFYLFAEGTTTPVTTFSDAALTSSQSHPVVADANGTMAQPFVEAGTYRVRVTSSADVVKHDIDGVEVVDALQVASNLSGNNGNVLGVDGGVYDFINPRKIITGTGSANAHFITTDPALSSFGEGDSLIFFPAATSTATSVTINVSGLGALTAVRPGASDLPIGFIQSGKPMRIYRNGSDQLVCYPLDPVIETGTGGNGRFTKYSDGRLVNELEGVSVTGLFTWNFEEDFANSSYSVFLGLNSATSDPIFLRTQSKTTSSVEVVCYDDTSTPDSSPADLLASGRWF